MSKKVQLEGNFGGSREDIYPATMAEIVYTKDGKNLEEKINETNAQLSDLNNKKANITDLTNDRVFKGADTTENILLKSGENGDYYYSTDECCYYLKSDYEWINIGYGDNKINSMVSELNIDIQEGKFLNKTANISTISNDNFSISTINLNGMERIEVSGTCVDAQRLVALYDDNNTLIWIYPNTNENLPEKSYTHVFDVPLNAKKMIVSSYKTVNYVKLLPVLSLGDMVGETVELRKKSANLEQLINKEVEFLTEKNKYISQDGSVKETSVDSFEFTSLEVKQNQYYKIIASCQGTQRIYRMVSNDGSIVDVFPNASGKLPSETYNAVVKIPKDVTRIDVCSVGTNIEIKSIPMLTIHDIDNDEENYCEVSKTLVENNEFLGVTGNFLTLTSSNFRTIEIDVNPHERFRVSGSVVDSQRLYSIVDKNNNVLTVFPNESGNLPLKHYDEVITIPQDGAKLRVCSYSKFRKNLIQLPIMTIENSKDQIEVKSSNNYNFLVNKVLCIGDSLTAGAYFGDGYNGSTIKEGYPYYLSRINQWEVTNGGRSGWSASNWYTSEKEKYDFAQFDTFIIWLGTNNGYTDTLDEDTAFESYHDYAETETGYYCKIIEYIKEYRPQANIFIFNVFASKGNVATSNLVLEKIGVKYNIPVFNMNDGSLYNGANQDLLHPFGNNVHFGKIGNITIANKMTNYINEYISNNLEQFEQVYLK